MGSFYLVLQATLLITSFSSKGGSVEIEDCQQQPDAVIHLFERMGSHPPCIFHKLDIHQSHIYSKLRVAEKNSFPDNNGWSHCKHCLWEDGNLFAVNAIAHSAVDISWSSWGEFFFADQNDQLKAEVVDSAADILSQSEVVESFIVRRPVFVLPMITFHVGHIIIDLLEEVYHTMMTEYGEVRTDSLLILDVAGVEERSILQEKIFTNTLNPEHDTFASTLRLLSALPIFSKDLFVELQKQNMHIVFADLHVGIDTSKSFFSRGYEHHPCIFNKARGEEIRMLSNRYQSFQQFAWRAFSLKAVDPPAVPVNTSKAARAENEHEMMIMNLLFIDRKNSRVIANSDALLSAATGRSRSRYGGRGMQTLAVDLGQLSFTHQLQVLARADIMVAIAGTAVHNILFMRPGSVVVIIMQPGWCKWAWMYANQAVLLDIHPLVHCVPPLPTRGHKGKGRGGSDTQALPSNTSISAGLGGGGGGQCSSEPDSLDGDDDGTRDIAPGENAFHWARKYWLQGPRFTKGEDVIVDEAAFALLLDQAVTLAQTGSGSTAATAEEVGRGSGGFDGERNAPQPSPPLVACGDHLIVERAEPHRAGRGGLGRGTRHSPSVQLFVSSVTSQEVGPNEWKLGIMGEVVWWGDQDTRSATPFESLPHLAVCLQSLLTSLDHICFPFSSFNYYAHLYMTITFPVQFVHLWAQAQGRGQGSGGKLRGSDAFVVLDTRLGPSAGFHVHGDAVGSVVASGVNKSMYQRLATRYSLQQLSRDFVAQCAASSSSSSSRLRLPASVPAHCLEAVARTTATAYAETLRRALGLPEVQPLPSPAQPFVFIHVEKCAGTTLREFITESAEVLGLDYYIPCHGGLHCVTLSIADASPVHRASLWNVSVVAGHFSWGVWEQLPRWRKCILEQTRERTLGEDTVGVDAGGGMDGATKRPVRVRGGEGENHGDGRASRDGVGGSTGGPVDSAHRPPPPCFVMGRHPVDRAISYYYQRCYGVEGCIGHGRPINEIAVDELEAVAIYHREAKYKEDNITLVVLDEGMSETSCRALANVKSTTGLIVGVDEVQVPPTITEAVTAEALANVQKCVVGILERWNETKTVMKHWFPWIDLVKRDADRRKMFLYKDKETVATLRADLRQVLLRLNHCDMLIYDKMISIFNNQLEVVAAVRDAFVPPF